MLQSRRFTESILRNPSFGSRCLSVFIDEAHCISHWGDSFRKKYATIGIVRAFLPKCVPFIAVSATLTPRVRWDIVRKLEIHPTNHTFINVGNDRPNVTQVVRAIQHSITSYADLDFVIPTATSSITDVPKTMLYTDDIKEGARIIDHLNAQVPDHLRHLGLVRPYNAVMSRKYRKDSMRLFRAGVIRVLVCTDAAGMVCSFQFAKSHTT